MGKSGSGQDSSLRPRIWDRLQIKFGMVLADKGFLHPLAHGKEGRRVKEFRSYRAVFDAGAAADASLGSQDGFIVLPADDLHGASLGADAASDAGFLGFGRHGFPGGFAVLVGAVSRNHRMAENIAFQLVSQLTAKGPALCQLLLAGTAGSNLPGDGVLGYKDGSSSKGESILLQKVAKFQKGILISPVSIGDYPAGGSAVSPHPAQAGYHHSRNPSSVYRHSGNEQLLGMKFLKLSVRPGGGDILHPYRAGKSLGNGLGRAKAGSRRAEGDNANRTDFHIDTSFLRLQGKSFPWVQMYSEISIGEGKKKVKGRP